MLSIENIDGKIWNKDLVFKNLITLFKQDLSEYQISTAGEGPDLQTSGIEDIIKDAAEYSNITINKINIFNGNLLKSSNIFRESTKNYLSELFKYRNYIIPESQKTIKLHFGLFVGRSNWARLWIATHLFSKYKKSTLFSYHWANRHEYHQQHTGLEELLDRSDDFNLIRSAVDFLSNCPIPLTNPSSYPILFDKDPLDLKFYKNMFLDIVLETYFTGNVFFCTEKTWRPIEAMTPFITFGPQYFLKNLKQMGFETFSNWWSEDYDKYSYHARLPEIIKIIDNVGNWSIDDCTQVYNEMRPVLLHNKNVLQTLTWEKIENIQFYNTESNE
jgi:hypothetical protein